MSGGPEGRLLASGRDADIFEHGAGLVLRRSRKGRSLEYEARIMELVRSRGYPVPAVEELRNNGTEIVMERIDGPSLVDAVARRPWTVRRCAPVLVDLHRRLHQIEAPSWATPSPLGPGDRLVHLDLHPLNVIVGRDGPVVIDWPRASSGVPEDDVALTWLLIASGEIPQSKVMALVSDHLRRMVIGGFLSGFDREALSSRLGPVAEWKCEDQNMSPTECAAMRRLVAQETGKARGSGRV